MGYNVEIWVATLAIAQRIGISHQMAKGPIRLDQHLYASSLAHLIFF